MKLEVFEFSGKPIELTDRVKAKELFAEGMDTLEAEMGKCTPDNAIEFQTRLIEMVDVIIEEMPISKTVEFDSFDELQAIISDLGNTLTICVEEEGLIGYIATTEE